MLSKATECTRHDNAIKTKKEERLMQRECGNDFDFQFKSCQTFIEVDPLR